MRIAGAVERFSAQTHTSRKNKGAARLHPMDEGLSMGTPGWGTASGQ
jgi:hypothetical protein